MIADPQLVPWFKVLRRNTLRAKLRSMFGHGSHLCRRRCDRCIRPVQGGYTMAIVTTETIAHNTVSGPPKRT